MSQLQPPPFPPGAPQGGPTMPAAVAGPPPYSGMAIAAFVLSLLGFLGCTAVLGIILGIVGIVVTRGGRRRGKGLAIAAIPISVATAAVSLLLVASFMIFAELPPKVEAVFKASAEARSVEIAALREFASEEFNESVTDEVLEAWLAHVAETHGKLIELKPDPTAPVGSLPDGKIGYNLSAKFVNGTVTVQLVFSKRGLLKFVLDDITVSGSSPRDDE